MLLDTIEITRNNRFLNEEKPDFYRCRVGYTTSNGDNLKFNLSPKLADRVLELVADEIVLASKEAARMITNRVIEFAPTATIPGTTHGIEDQSSE